MVARARRCTVATGEVFKRRSLKPALNLDDVTCPICLEILIEPVTTPCNHESCLECFQKNVELVHISCPVCRQRLSVWVRQAVRKNKLVNDARWEQIQRHFPEHVRRRLNKEDGSFCTSDAPAVHTQPGEIRKEYEELLRQYQEERERERKAEALASERLIRELLRQDEHQMVEETGRRHHITRQHEVLNSDLSRQNIKYLRTRSRTSLSCKTYRTRQQISKTMKGSLTSEILASLDTENTQIRSSSAESNDSISSEMCHFKPISAAPRTPPRRLPDGRFQEPEVVYTKPRRLDYSECQSSKVLSKKIEAIMVNMSECGLVQFHSSTTSFINKKNNSARKSNIDLSLKENYPFYSGNRSQSLSPSKSILTGSNQNGSTLTRGIKNTRPCKVILRSECIDESNQSRKRKVDDKSGPCKTSKVGSKDETSASTSASQPQSTNYEERNQLWVEMQCNLQERINQEEKDRQLALQLQEEFNKFNQQREQGNQYFLRSQKKK